MRINRTLTKKYILDNVDEIDIFSEYLEVDDRYIETCIRDNIRMSSPLRVDDDPSVGFKYNSKGRLKMRDFAGYFWGDCFDLVAYVHNLNVNKKQDFYNILYDIAVRFGLIKDESYNLNYVATKKHRVKLIRENKKHKIEITVRAWAKNDLDYWKVIYKNSRNVKQYLSYLRIYAVDHYWIDRDSQPEPKYNYRASDPCYAYYFGKDEKGIDDIKLYFPKRGKTSKYPKFITNASNVGGLDYLPAKMDMLLITKSYKDFGSILSYVVPINPLIGVISLASESTPITKLEYDALSARVTKTFKDTGIKAVFTLLDFDLAGIRMSNKMRRDLNTIPFFLTNGRFNTVNYEGKDFTDTITEKGRNFIENLVVSTIVEINKLIK